ncbi:MAG TPA: hypothetical protein VNJ31_12070 [Methyloceanibacter sp.]|nr:hypothetical protein [Methyloceanibacter sp.]
MRVEAAILELQKLDRYILNPRHPRGRHKARVFKQTLGIERSDAVWLRQALLEGIKKGDAVATAADAFGKRYRIDVPLERQGRRAVVRTVWIERSGETVPRFITCWVL